MLKHIFALTLVATAVTPTHSAPAPAWTVVGSGSAITFGGAMNGQAFQGRFARWAARIAFDPKNLPASRVVAAIETASARTGDQTRDEAMPTDDWFAVRSFPRATFTSTAIAAAGPNRYIARGTLTIRGVSRPVALPFTLTIAGDVAKMSGSLAIDRAAFGVGQGQWKTGDAVALNVRVDIRVTARRMPQSR